MLPIVAVILAACSSGDTKPEAPAPVSAPEPVAAVPAPKAAVNPNAVKIRAGAPSRYVVKKGDTLWDISKKFLQEPWRWPEVWYFNPQIKNPHLIYPGDVLMLSYNERGEPVIGIVGDDGYNPYPNGKLVNGVMKLSPYARGESRDAIPAIDMDELRHYMRSARVVSLHEFDNAPRVVGSLDRHLVANVGSEIYALGMEKTDLDTFQIVRKGRELKDPKSEKTLGYEAREVARAKAILRSTDPALPSTLLVTHGPDEVLKGDYLMPVDNTTDGNFMPSTPEQELRADVIATHGGTKNVGNSQVVVISKGAKDGIKAGNVLGFSTQGGFASIKDAKNHNRKVNVPLPDVRAGLGMVFRVFENVSYVVVLETTRQISVGDVASTPHAGVDY